jgi:spore maturation protein B
MSTWRMILDDLPKFVIPLMLVSIPLYGLFKRVAGRTRSSSPGRRRGFHVAVRILPYLVAILFAISMFRASGAMGYIETAMRPLLDPLGIPPEICRWPSPAR